MFWKVWRFGTALLFAAFLAIVFADNCSFIYHNDNTASFTTIAEFVLLVSCLLAVFVDMFFGE